MEQKQTAVEWLLNQLIFKQEYEHLPNNYFLMSDKDIDSIIQQAKEMEKQQIIDANEDATTNELGEFLTGKQYYNQEYGK